jgi:hypothetical protein
VLLDSDRNSTLYPKKIKNEVQNEKNSKKETREERVLKIRTDSGFDCVC